MPPASAVTDPDSLASGLHPPGGADDLPAPRPLVRLLLAAVVVLAFALRAWDASGGLHGGESFDEQFSLANVAGVLAGRGLGPQQAFYPSLSYLPQAAVLFVSEQLHRATGLPALAVFTTRPDGSRGGWSPTAYFLCRLTNVAFGTASLLLVFAVGRRLFGDWEGLAAAVVLAAFRRHLVSSAHFKPDILVLLLTLLAFHWSLLAAWRPTRRGFLRAGLGVGLAAAAKYTGAGAAIALVAAVLARWRDRRQLGWLVLAGVTSVATFLALNPWVADLYRFLMRLEHGYSLTGVEERSSHWVVLQRETASVLRHHGWPALFVVGGLVALAWLVARPASAVPPWDERRRLGAWMLLAQTVGYALAHAFVFPVFRAQNILPIAPFTSLVAGWALVEAYRALARRWSALRGPAVATAVVAAILLSLAWKPAAEVYARAVPNTWQVAATVAASRLEMPGLRSVAYHGPHREFELAARRQDLVTFPVPADTEAADPVTALADAEAFAIGPRPRDSQPRTLGGTTVTVEPRLFSSRGETVTLLLHPWLLAATERLPLAEVSPGRLAAALPALAPGTPISLAVWRHRFARGPAELTLEPGGERLPLFTTARRHGDQQLVTRRFALPGGSGRVVFAAPSAPPSAARRPPRLELYLWREP